MADLQGRKVFKVFNQDFIVDERYTVTKELGQGAYGIVWWTSFHLQSVTGFAGNYACSLKLDAAVLQYPARLYREIQLTRSKHSAATNNQTGEGVAIKKVTNVFSKKILAKRALREIKLLQHFRGHRNVRPLTMATRLAVIDERKP